MSAARDPSPSLISASTILILSAFLIGASLGGFLEPQLASCVMLCGCAGVAAFFLLELLAFRRRRRALECEQKHVEDRLQKHVDPARRPEMPLAEAAENAAREQAARAVAG